MAADRRDRVAAAGRRRRRRRHAAGVQCRSTGHGHCGMDGRRCGASDSPPGRSRRRHRPRRRSVVRGDRIMTATQQPPRRSANTGVRWSLSRCSAPIGAILRRRSPVGWLISPPTIRSPRLLNACSSKSLRVLSPSVPVSCRARRYRWWRRPPTTSGRSHRLRRPPPGGASSPTGRCSKTNGCWLSSTVAVAWLPSWLFRCWLDIAPTPHATRVHSSLPARWVSG